MELALIVAAVVAVCAGVVAVAWRHGGPRVGLWALGLVGVALASAAGGLFLLVVEALCEGETCTGTPWDVVLLALSPLAFLAAVCVALRSRSCSAAVPSRPDSVPVDL